jgi:membrane-associated phospholipid phosphatase
MTIMVDMIVLEALTAVNGRECGFPSGHAVVFSAFFTAVWLYYPRYRVLVVVALSALALALLLTSYHFVSDISAGILCGALLTAGLHRFLSRSGSIRKAVDRR